MPLVGGWESVALVLAAVVAGAVLLLRKRVTTVNGIPYVVGWPVIGCLLDFLPEKILTSLDQYRRKYGNFLAIKLLGTKVFLISDAKIAREVLMRRPKTFRKPRNLLEYSGNALRLNLGLFHSNGAAWSRMRRVTAPSFSSQNISSKLHAILEENEQWMKRLSAMVASGQPIDMTQEAFSLTIRVLSRSAFGLPPENPFSSYFFSPVFISDMRRLFEFSIRFTLLRLPVWIWRRSPMMRLEEEAVAAEQRLVTACQPILQHKRELLLADPSVASAMIDQLILKDQHHSKDASGLTDEEIIQNVKVFYLAGTDTTAITISWLTYFLSLYPNIQERVFQEAQTHIFSHRTPDGRLAYDHFSARILQEMPFTYAVFKETLRIRNAASLLPFELEEGVDSYTLSNGHTVQQQDIAWVYVDGVLWDENIFPDSQAFRPERWLSATAEMEEAFISFGQGPRICPGMMLASVEATLAIAFLVNTFHISLAGPAEEIERWMLVTSAPSQMPLKLVPRNAKQQQS